MNRLITTLLLLTFCLLLLAFCLTAAQAEQLCFRDRTTLFLTVEKQQATVEPLATVSLVGALLARQGRTVQPVIGSGVRRGDFWIFDIDGVPNMKLDLGFNPVFPPNWTLDVACALPSE